ncbi:MAG TPA: hypothetical protein VF254_02430 [Gammaproteobacteria bacterium]
MSLRQQGRLIAERIDALSLRERAMLMIGAFMVMFLVWDWLLMSEITARSKTISEQIEVTRNGVARLNEAIAITAQVRGGDPDDALRARLAAAERRIAALDAELARRAGQVIPPGEMAEVLENILERQGRLELLSVKSLPPEALFETEAGAGTALPGSIYRHGLEMEVEGRYLDVLAYLRELEALDWKFFWDAVELESEDYPANRVRIRIYSLNLEEGWLGV